MSISVDITESETTEDIVQYDTEHLIKFLKKNISVKEEQLNILREQEVTGYTFFETTEDTFRSYGLKGGPAKILANFAKSCVEKSAEKRKGAFPSFKTLKDLRSVLKR